MPPPTLRLSNDTARFRLFDYNAFYLDLRSDTQGRYKLATPNVFGADVRGEVRGGAPTLSLTWPTHN